MNKLNNALLGIDLQKDFMDLPGSSLPVTGAVEDTKRLVKFIERDHISHIITSIDSHYALDISHPSWWKKADGSFVDPFTVITPESIHNGTFTPRIDPKRSLKYVEDLQAQGEFPHFIWPEHCLMGSEGQTLNPLYLDALSTWSKKTLRWPHFINKGVNPHTEHFGIFRANIPIDADSTTQLNQDIFKTLNNYDTIYLAGQAKSHCVVNSLKQLVEFAPHLAPKVVILEDCMSDVTGLSSDFYDNVQKIYDDAVSKGVKVARSTDI